MKTNAVRMLDSTKIHYELREYTVDPEDLSAETVAAKVICRWSKFSKRWSCVEIVMGSAWRSFPATPKWTRRQSRTHGRSACGMVPLKEVQALTGYIRGGVTALAGKKDYPIYVDETAELFDVISISAGMRGLQILLAPADYLQITNATIGAIAR